MDFVQSAVDGAGINTPVVAAVRSQYKAAMDKGLSEADMAVLFNMLEK